MLPVRANGRNDQTNAAVCTNTPTYRHTNTPTHQITNTPTHQHTNTSINTNTPRKANSAEKRLALFNPHSELEYRHKGATEIHSTRAQSCSGSARIWVMIRENDCLIRPDAWLIAPVLGVPRRPFLDDALRERLPSSGLISSFASSPPSLEGGLGRKGLQGYLGHKKQSPPRTLQ